MSISSVLSTLTLWGRGAKHAKCFFKVFGYYVHLLSKNIAGLAVHGGNGAVTICWFLFFVLLSSLQALGGWRRTQADLVVGCFVIRSAHGLKDKRMGQSHFVAIWMVTETGTRRAPTTVPSYHHHLHQHHLHHHYHHYPQGCAYV